MKFKTVAYHALFNLGDYENEKIELVAILEEGDTVESLVPMLRNKAISLALPNNEKSWRAREKLVQQIKELEQRLAKRQREWEEAAEFLRCQGIKTDMASFSKFSNLLPSAASETVEMVDAEIDEIDDDQ